uniref:Uncharacterized protein n=1 Tax=Noctiluca scintillans TaxID=2966 RepID=A0A7S1F502_NOCSC|mmetsp:Transcript_34259/g.91476  ORF Transcript_34259/g.91476 Transcript_34259/m.91476 type:complete len:1145 (+) Transcript_34259:64-3498(+)
MVLAPRYAGDAPQIRDLHRAAASSALRRLVLAAAACDGAAGAAATAADEIAQLRVDVARAASREEQRVRLVSYSSNLKDDREDPQTAGRAAHANAEAVLQSHRRARAALRRQASLDALAADTAAAERSKKEAQAAIASAHQAAASELAALRSQVDEEAESRRRHAEEANRLGDTLRRAQADSASSSERFASARAADAAVMKQLREELAVARQEATREAEEAVSSRRAAALATEQLEASRHTVALHSDEHAALTREVASAAEQAVAVQNDLEAERASWARARARNQEMVHDNVAMVLVSRRAQASRHFLASLLASELEGLVCSTFSSWRGVRVERLRAREASLERRRVEDGRQQAVADLLSEAAEVERLREGLQAATAHAENASRTAADTAAADVEAAVAECRAAEAGKQELLKTRNLASLLSRREQACRRVLATTLAAQAELPIRGVFYAWRAVGSGLDKVALSEQMLEEQSHEAARWRQQAAVQSDKASRVEQLLADESSEAARWRKQAADEADRANSSESRYLEQSRDVARWRSEAEQAEEARRKHHQISAEKSEAQQTISDEVSALEARLRDATAEVARLKGCTATDAEATASARARAVELTEMHLLSEVSVSVLLRREAVGRRVLASSLAMHLELLVRGAFNGWRMAFRKSLGDGQGSQESMRNVVATLLAVQLEQLVRGSFSLWRQMVRMPPDKASDPSMLQSQEEVSRLRESLKRSEAETVVVRRKVDDLADQVDNARDLRRRLEIAEETALLVASDTSEVKRLKSQLDLAESQVRSVGDQVADAKHLRRQLDIKDAEVDLVERKLREQLGESREQASKANSRAETLQLEIQSTRQSALRADALSRLLQRRETATRRMFVSMLAAQWEAAVLGVFVAWRDVTVCASLAVPTNTWKQESTKAAEAVAIAQHYARRESALRAFVATLLAGQLVALLRGTFSSWYAAVVTVSGGQSVASTRGRAGEIAEIRDGCLPLKESASGGDGGVPWDLHKIMGERDRFAAEAASAQAALERLQTTLAEADADRDQALRHQRVARESAMFALDGMSRCVFALWRVATSRGRGVEACEADPAGSREAMALALRLFARREEATRRVVASLLATQLEVLMKGIFAAWREGACRALAERVRPASFGWEARPG